MLVLSRMVGEKVIIGEGLIEVCVVAIKGDKVKIGFKAPRDISVHREEVANAIAQEAQSVRGDSQERLAIHDERPS